MASALAEMLAARACDPPGKSFISTAMASAIPYIVRPPASTHTAAETRCVRTVSATSARLRLLRGSGCELREEHLLQRQLAAGELGDVALVPDDRLDAVHPYGAQLLDRADPEQAPLADHADPVADQLHLGQQVGGQQHRRATGSRLPDKPAELPLHQGVQTERRLVEDQQVR